MKAQSCLVHFHHFHGEKKFFCTNLSTIICENHATTSTIRQKKSAPWVCQKQPHGYFPAGAHRKHTKRAGLSPPPRGWLIRPPPPREIRFRGHHAQVDQQAVAPPVDVRRHRHAASAADLRRIGSGTVRRAISAGVLLIHHLVVGIHHQLPAKEGGAVFHGRQMSAKNSPASPPPPRGKVAQHMHFLPGGNLHARQQDEVERIRCLLYIGQVSGTIMVRYGNGIQPLMLAMPQILAGVMSSSRKGSGRNGCAGPQHGSIPRLGRWQAAVPAGRKAQRRSCRFAARPRLPPAPFPGGFLHLDTLGNNNRRHFHQGGHGDDVHVRLHGDPGHALLAVCHDPTEQVAGIATAHLGVQGQAGVMFFAPVRAMRFSRVILRPPYSRVFWARLTICWAIF